MDRTYDARRTANGGILCYCKTTPFLWYSFQRAPWLGFMFEAEYPFYTSPTCLKKRFILFNTEYVNTF